MAKLPSACCLVLGTSEGRRADIDYGALHVHGVVSASACRRPLCLRSSRSNAASRQIRHCSKGLVSLAKRRKYPVRALVSRKPETNRASRRSSSLLSVQLDGDKRTRRIRIKERNRQENTKLVFCSPNLFLPIARILRMVVDG